MIGVWMELSRPTTHTRPPPARSSSDTPTPTVTEALPQLFEDWETETMHAHGWSRTPQPEAPPSPPAHLSLVPCGRG